jgi:hypothetical protein
VGNSIFSISLDNGMVKESGVTVTKDGPIPFSTLQVVGFLLDKEVMMLLGEVLLKGEILLAGRL